MVERDRVMDANRNREVDMDSHVMVGCVQYETPYVAIILNGVLTLGLSVFSFTALAEVDMLFYNMSTVP